MRQTADWLKRNSLQFNKGKTEVMYCSPARIPKPLLAEFRLSPEEEPLAPVNTVRKPGVIMDSNLQMESQANKTIKVCLSLICVLRQVLPLLPKDSRALVVRSTVLSRLDYCNSLYLGAPQYIIQGLQRVLSIAAKVTLNRQRSSSTTAALNDLHWLPIRERISFKSLCMVFRAVHDTGPLPLQDKFNWYEPKR